jgi:thiamine-phosphate pyrophosphorylase
MFNPKNVERLHYLTQDNVPGFSHAELAEKACEAGIRWVQFRSKKLTGDELVSEARKVKDVTDKYSTVLIINDHVNLAAELGVGVHLGKNDMSIREARKILGDNAIIGGTANTADDIICRVDEGADYIGLGPYRFTTTKENLSPVIPIDELKRLLTLQNKIPIIIIGGITPHDVKIIMSLGAYGVAVSSAINMHPDKAAQVQYFFKSFQLQEV